MDLPSAVKKYIDHVSDTAHQHGVKLNLIPQNRIPYGTCENLLVSGYFIDRPIRELAVGTDKPLTDWLGILVHEACHMDQWIEQAAVWNDIIVEGREAVDWIDDWCQGKDDLPMPIENLIDRARNVEWDCERRAHAAIVKNDLPIDPHHYAQKANAYVYFYNHLLKTRAWNRPDNSPYEIKRVWVHAPSHFMDTTGETPASLQHAFEQEYPPLINRLFKVK